MKKLIYILFALLSITVSAQTTDLVPDAVWADDNHRDWCDKGMGTTTLSYNGLFMVFNYQGNGTRKGGHAYMYQINQNCKTNLDDVNMDDYKVGPSADHDNRIEFNFPGESSSYDEGAVLGRAFTFTFNGTGWFFMHIRSEYYKNDHDTNPVDESYECFAELPADDSKKCHTYYDTIHPHSTVLKQGGFQLDSMMYFLAWEQNNSKWVIQEHTFNSNTAKFSGTGNNIHPNLPKQLNYLGGLLLRTDTAENQYIVATFYDGNGGIQLGKFVPGVSNGKRIFTWVSLIGDVTSPFTTPNSPAGASALAQGSMRAKRSAGDINNKNSSDRVILFGESLGKYSDGNYHIWYIEYRVENDTFIPMQAKGTIMVPSSNGPHLVSNYYQLLTGYQLFPKDNSTYMQGVDGFDQYMWFIYPDQNRHFHGAMFESDRWQMIENQTVDSPDLDNDDPVHGYTGISSLWTLAAILDGPPPISMNWDTWNNYWGFPVPATEIVLSTTSSGSTDFTNESENGWSAGEKIKMTSIKDQEYKGNSEEFKYSVQWENSTTTSNDTTVSYEQPIDLMDGEYQDYGRYLYMVPQMKRFSYSLYPWWDADMQQYPVPGTFQYLFHTYNQFPKLVLKPLQEFPFEVEEPNGAWLPSWSRNSRPNVDSAIREYDLRACMNLNWTDGSNGNTSDLSIGSQTVTSSSTTSSWDFEVTAGATTIKIPKVCEMEVYLSTGYSGSLKNETTTTTTFEKRISSSITNLHSIHQGIQQTTLNLSAFMLLPETSHWWYLDSLAGQTPWYLVWVANTPATNLLNLSPSNGSVFDTTGTIFSWRPEEGELYDYELFISKRPWVEGYSSLYRKKVQHSREALVSDFKPEPGVTYYWSVRAFDAAKQMVWSPIWSFTLPETSEEPVTPATESIKTVISSNPGPASEIRIVMSPAADGPVTLSMRNLNGAEVYRKEVTGAANQVIAFTLAGTHLAPGLYFAVIQSAGERIVKKIIIN
jgi:hypothetical protein